MVEPPQRHQFFFTGMDQILGTNPGIWLGRDQHLLRHLGVLELLWTLARGFEGRDSWRRKLGQKFQPKFSGMASRISSLTPSLLRGAGF